jgi:hypothetical protein
MNGGQKLGGFVLFSSGDGSAELLFNAAQAGLDGAVVELLALAVPHPAFG